MLGSMEPILSAIPVGGVVLKLWVAEQRVTTAPRSYCCCRNVRKSVAHLHRKISM